MAQDRQPWDIVWRWATGRLTSVHLSDRLLAFRQVRDFHVTRKGHVIIPPLQGAVRAGQCWSAVRACVEESEDEVDGDDESEEDGDEEQPDIKWSRMAPQQQQQPDLTADIVFQQSCTMGTLSSARIRLRDRMISFTDRDIRVTPKGSVIFLPPGVYYLRNTLGVSPHPAP